MNSYLDQLKAFVKEDRKASPRDRNVVSFLAVKNDVTAALAAGYSMRAIWRHMTMSKRIEVHYESFLNYVKKYIAEEAHSAEFDRRSPTPPPIAEGFKFSPIGKKEELL